MAKNFQFVEKDYVLSIFTKRTKLRKSEINLISDLIILLIKKKIILTNELEIFNFGKFYIKKTFTRRKILRLYLRNKFWLACKGKADFKYRDWDISSDSLPLIESLSVILNISKRHAKFIFILFFVGISQQLLLTKKIKLDHFGQIIKKDSVTADNKDRVQLFFIVSDLFNKELNGKKENLHITHRLKNIIKIHKINISTK